MAWPQSDHVEQKLQPAGLIEPVVVVEVELYSPVVQWVQIMVGVVEVELCSPAVMWVQMMVVVVEVGESHARCSPKLAMVGPDAHQSSVPVPI